MFDCIFRYWPSLTIAPGTSPQCALASLPLRLMVTELRSHRADLGESAVSVVHHTPVRPAAVRRLAVVQTAILGYTIIASYSLNTVVPAHMLCGVRQE